MQSDILGTLSMEFTADTCLSGPSIRSQLLSQVEQHTRVGIVVLDRGGIVRHWGPAAQQALGYNDAEALGRPVPGVAGHGRDALDSGIRCALGGDTWHGGVARFERKDGSRADLRVSVHPLYDDREEVIGAAMLIVDVTENQRFRDLHRRLSEVMSAVRGFADLDDILRLVRDAIVDLGGFDRAGVFQVVGSEVWGAWGTDSDGRPQRTSDVRETLDDWGASMGDLASGKRPFVIEPWTPPADDDMPAHPIEHVVMVMRAGEELVGLISADNLISGRPVTETDVLPLIPFAEEAAIAIRAARLLQQVRSYAEDMERQVAVRTAELESAVADLEQFTYRVAHDLRAPLRAIDGMVHLLRDEVEEKGSATWADIAPRAERISSSARFAGRLVDDLLTLARVGRRPLNRRETDPRDAALDAWRAFEASGKTQDVRLDVRPMPMVIADREMLVEVYSRVLDNALKFTHSRPVPVIEIGARRAPGQSEPTLYVRDNGVGFDPNHAERVFSAFARVHATEEFEGSGVGLAIVRRIMERHGGQVWAEAVPGEGATFLWSFPAA